MEVEMNVKITGTFGTVDFTQDEAKEMYYKLKEIFEVPKYTFIPCDPLPRNPWTDPIITYEKGTAGAEW